MACPEIRQAWDLPQKAAGNYILFAVSTIAGPLPRRKLTGASLCQPQEAKAFQRGGERRKWDVREASEKG